MAILITLTLINTLVLVVIAIIIAKIDTSIVNIRIHAADTNSTIRHRIARKLENIACYLENGSNVPFRNIKKPSSIK